MRGRDHSDWSILYSMVGGLLLSGLLLLAICLPLSYVSATLAGDSPVVTILLLRSGDAMGSFLGGPALGALTYSEMATVSAYLAMIGASALSLPLVYAVARREGVVKLLTLIYGMLLGLSFTSAWFEWSNTGRIEWLAPKAGEIAYIYLAFLTAEAGKVALAGKEIAALPYLYAIDGIFGTVAVLIIHVGYDPSFSSLLLGPFFLIAVAAAIATAEWLLFRPGTIFATGVGLAITDPEFERRFAAEGKGGWSRFKLLVRATGGGIGAMRRVPYPKRARMVERALSKAFRQMPRRRGSLARLIDWRVVAATCAGNLLFLLFGMVLARFVR